MTTIDPTQLERPIEIKDIIAIQDVAQLQIASRALAAEVHLLEARLTHARELQKLAAERAKSLGG